MSNKLKILNEQKIRTAWNAEEEEWYFSVVDVVAALTNSTNPTDYLKKLRKRDTELGEFLGTNCPQVEMVGASGRKRKVLAASTKAILRLIQSIPSPNAEPFKMWLAQVGSERLDEIADPEKAITRGTDYYRAKGYSDGWITQRLQGIEMRKNLTDEWKERGVSGSEYAILTNDMTKAWSGMTVKEYKELKGLHKENLRDNMTDIELVLNMLAEVTTTAISKREQPETFDENRNVARKGGTVAKRTRNDIEQTLGYTVISDSSATDKNELDTGIKSLPDSDETDE
ncbi:MAG: Bro-N domain-containing protein [Clostridia bacterium]|nr:Bro-N domain-containing protein [Clostridia bacterium]